MRRAQLSGLRAELDQDEDVPGEACRASGSAATQVGLPVGPGSDPRKTYDRDKPYPIALRLQHEDTRNLLARKRD